MNIPLLCIAALGLLTIALGLVVSMERRRSRMSVGCPDDPQSALYKAVRAHGNTTEYAPVLMVLIYALGQLTAAGWVIGSMIGATFCRYLLAMGLLLPQTLAKPNPLRLLGAAGTYLFGLALCLALFLRVLAFA